MFVDTEWIKKNTVYIHNRIVSTHKKTIKSRHLHNMIDLKDIMLSEISHKQKGKYFMLSLIRGL